ncbi:MAG: nitroreductase family protein [Bacteroidetes bacterium]|nr:nitroreductase family protein [Bacteroidota bacterium]
MDFMELVKLRKSTRRYIDKKISRDLIDECVEAARMAPSACNSQPWSFIIVDDPKTKNEIVEKSMTGLYSLNKFAFSAPVLIVVLREKSRYAARLAGTLRDVKYSLLDIGIACDHLTLRAAELGLGTCWIGWFNEKNIKKILGLPKAVQVDVVISIGYSEDDLPKVKSRKTLDAIRTYHAPKS